jgi:hypothetical protein
MTPLVLLRVSRTTGPNYTTMYKGRHVEIMQMILKCMYRILIRLTLMLCRYFGVLLRTVDVKYYSEDNALPQGKITKKTSNKVLSFFRSEVHSLSLRSPTE